MRRTKAKTVNLDNLLSGEERAEFELVRMQALAEKKNCIFLGPGAPYANKIFEGLKAMNKAELDAHMNRATAYVLYGVRRNRLWFACDIISSLGDGESITSVVVYPFDIIPGV